MVSILGAGLLVGTALAVIIPEGVKSLGFAIKPLASSSPEGFYLFTY